MPSLKRAPGEVEQGDDPEEGVIGYHNMRPPIEQLLQVLLRMERQEEHEQDGGDNQDGVIEEAGADRAEVGGGSVLILSCGDDDGDG